MPLGMLYLVGLSLLIVSALTLTVVLNKGFILRQGDSTSMTLIHKDGHRVEFKDNPGAFAGQGQYDQARQRMEPKAFAEFIRAFFPPEEAQRILLSQPDIHPKLNSGEDVVDVDPSQWMG